MIIQQIRLHHFRNFESLRFEPDEKLTALLGHNAQGKTNLLEAIGLCATGRSHRISRDTQMIAWGEEGAYIGLDLLRGGVNRRIEIRLRRNKPKQIKIDGKSIARMGELMGCLNAVFFSPEDLRLVKDGPAERRRFLDMDISQTQPQYFHALSGFLHALAQRNALLKNIATGRQSADTLHGWNEQMAHYGGSLIAMRRAYVNELDVYAARLHRSISGGKEELSLQYASDISIESNETDRDALFRSLEQHQDEDIRRGLTQHGPQRDDLSLRLSGRDARLFASQGQQRSIALSIKLGELALMRQKTGESPVLLLDDVLSELDEKRQHLLIEATAEQQTFLTGTQLPFPIQGKRVWVENGTLSDFSES